MRARAIHSAGRYACVTAGLLLACGSDAGGPIARIERATGCVVPPGAVQVHDHLAGDARTLVLYAKVVLPKSQVDAFLRSCGFSVDDLRSGYDPRAMAPEEPLRWWNPPAPSAAAGASHVGEAHRSELLVAERDTDFVVFLKSVRRAR